MVTVWTRLYRGGEKWSESRYTINIKLTEFADKLHLECEGKFKE